MIPVQLSKPVKRPAGQMIISSQWVGNDDDLQFEVSYYDAAGMPDTISFTTANTNESRTGQIVMPSGAEAQDIDRDTVVAHLRMGSFCASALVGSFEWDNMWLEQEGAKDVQLACGTCVVSSRVPISDSCVELKLKKKGNNPEGTFLVGVDELTNYSFTPSTQLFTIAGSVKAQFPNYVHEYPNTILANNKRQDIVDYVNALDIWV